MASSNRSSGAPIIAGSIILVGILIVITLVILFRGDGSNTAEPSTTPAASISPEPEPSKSKRPKSPRPDQSPTPSASPSARPSPSPTPTLPPANYTVIRDTTERAANRDRRGEVKHVGEVRLYKTDKATCATRSGATVNVRYSDSPKFGVWYLCQKGERWLVTAGPLYGE
jgi:hypothetical protein